MEDAYSYTLIVIVNKLLADNQWGIQIGQSPDYSFFKLRQGNPSNLALLAAYNLVAPCFLHFQPYIYLVHRLGILASLDVSSNFLVILLFALSKSH